MAAFNPLPAGIAVPGAMTGFAAFAGVVRGGGRKAVAVVEGAVEGTAGAGGTGVAAVEVTALLEEPALAAVASPCEPLGASLGLTLTGGPDQRLRGEGKGQRELHQRQRPWYQRSLFLT